MFLSLCRLIFFTEVDVYCIQAFWFHGILLVSCWLYFLTGLSTIEKFLALARILKCFASLPLCTVYVCHCVHACGGQRTVLDVLLQVLFFFSGWTWFGRVQENTVEALRNAELSTCSGNHDWGYVWLHSHQEWASQLHLQIIKPGEASLLWDVYCLGTRELEP